MHVFVLKILKDFGIKQKKKKKNRVYNSILPYHAPHLWIVWDKLMPYYVYNSL